MNHGEGKVGARIAELIGAGDREASDGPHGRATTADEVSPI